MIKLYFPIAPVPKARPRVTRSGHCYTPKKTKDFEETIKQLAVLQMHKEGHKPLVGPLSIRVALFFKKPKIPKYDYPAVKPDLDNLIKSIFDSLNGVVWLDDAQICNCSVTKLYAPKPSISLYVYEGINAF